MNIGVMFFPPGRRPGTLRTLEEATTHLSQENNLHRVDQGPLNYRWKFGAGKWKWPRQLHAVRDASGSRLCGLVNGSVVGGVLPAAQVWGQLRGRVGWVFSLGREGGGSGPVPSNQLPQQVLQWRLSEGKLIGGRPSYEGRPPSPAPPSACPSSSSATR